MAKKQPTQLRNSQNHAKRPIKLKSHVQSVRGQGGSGFDPDVRRVRWRLPPQVKAFFTPLTLL